MRRFHDRLAARQSHRLFIWYTVHFRFEQEQRIYENKTKQRRKKNSRLDNDDGKLLFRFHIQLIRRRCTVCVCVRFFFSLFVCVCAYVYLRYEHRLHNPKGITQINSDFSSYVRNVRSSNNGDNVVLSIQYAPTAFYNFTGGR